MNYSQLILLVVGCLTLSLVGDCCPSQDELSLSESYEFVTDSGVLFFVICSVLGFVFFV